MDWRENLPLPEGLNNGLKRPTQAFLTEWFGSPAMPLTCKDQPDRISPRIKERVVPFAFAQFKDAGLAPAVDSLLEILVAIRHDKPELFDHLGEIGMRNVRLIKHIDGTCGPGISTHAWASAIDITVDGHTQRNGKGKAWRGYVEIFAYFNKAGWFAGAGYKGSSQDNMHFEASETLIRSWFPAPV